MTRRPKYAADRQRHQASRNRNRGRSASRASADIPRRRRRVRLDRKKTFRIYVLIVVIPTTGIIVLCLSVWAHNSFIPGFVSFVWRSLSSYGVAVVNHPTLLLALPVTVVFLWSVPWEAIWEFIIAVADADDPSKGHRRGRRMLNHDQAQQQAHWKRQNRRRRT